MSQEKRVVLRSSASPPRTSLRVAAPPCRHALTPTPFITDPLGLSRRCRKLQRPSCSSQSLASAGHPASPPPARATPCGGHRRLSALTQARAAAPQHHCRAATPPDRGPRPLSDGSAAPAAHPRLRRRPKTAAPSAFLPSASSTACDDTRPSSAPPAPSADRRRGPQVVAAPQRRNAAGPRYGPRRNAGPSSILRSCARVRYAPAVIQESSCAVVPGFVVSPVVHRSGFVYSTAPHSLKGEDVSPPISLRCQHCCTYNLYFPCFPPEKISTANACLPPRKDFHCKWVHYRFS